jgi:hypothetical protein
MILIGFYIGCLEAIFLMCFSFSGRTQTQTNNSQGKFMDVVIIWDFPGKGWLAYPRYKM